MYMITQNTVHMVIKGLQELARIDSGSQVLTQMAHWAYTSDLEDDLDVIQI